MLLTQMVLRSHFEKHWTRERVRPSCSSNTLWLSQCLCSLLLYCPSLLFSSVDQAIRFVLFHIRKAKKLLGFPLDLYFLWIIQITSGSPGRAYFSQLLSDGVSSTLQSHLPYNFCNSNRAHKPQLILKKSPFRLPPQKDWNS